MSSTYVKPASIGQVNRPSRRRAGLIGLGAVVAGVTAVGAAVAIFLAPAEVPALPAPRSAVAVPASPIQAYAVEGTQGYEWRVKSAADRYAVAEGPFGYETVGGDVRSAPTIAVLGPHIDSQTAVESGDVNRGYWALVGARPPSSFGHLDVTYEGYLCGSDGCVYVYPWSTETLAVLSDHR
jgi:secreted PhoX family phosphatase